ncbi:hypothetical protein [Halomonas sp. DN3]|uniref:hypothetical protein n=1 Tax=Halomonas sp. DN3 TaxID=2953657 RepID=UPI0020A13169|nr:hypothetical protein [Halomonas sp. DN3]USZ49719.1 hypothetical protein NKF27_19920 [Halomonas sp. DN3]
MIEEAIIHVGMHKTGSSSIQSTFHNLEISDDAPVGYLKLNSPNHSGFLMTLLSEKPEEYHANKLNGRSKEESRAIQQRFESEFEERLSLFCARKLVISGEDLSAPNVSESMLQRLKARLLRYCRSVRVIGYVRSPVGYMQSAFQQRLKGGVTFQLNVHQLWPHYRKRFESLDRVFGKKNVDLVPFFPSSLYKGDAVLDFSRRIGVAIGRDEVRRENESISLEACSVLFAMRKFLGVTPYSGYSADNDRIVRAVSRIGKEKLAFSPELVAPVMEAQRADLEWMNGRLGQSIEDIPRDVKTSIGSEAALLDVALAQGPELWKLIEETSDRNMALSTSESIDRLRQLTALAPLSHQAPYVTTPIFGDGAHGAGEPDHLLEQAALLFAHTEPEIARAFRQVIVPARRQVSREVEINTPPMPGNSKENH